MGIKSASLALPIVFLAYYYGSPPENFAGASQFKYPQIEISTGFIRGSTGVSRDGREYFQFLGIPYAEPPVDELRFESPLPAQKWDGVKITDRYKSPCLQLNFITGLIQGSEDCLYLNVFVPSKIAEEVTNTDPYSVNNLESGLRNRTSPHGGGYPVLVYIFGGYYMYGSSQLYGPQYWMDEDIIVVTLDYRVGALGFLNTGDGLIRGNMGLKDQNMALRWVQENIAAFNGDPTRVTLFGESAGASSVHFHILTERSKGLFSKAISNSGTALRTWQLVDHPAEQAKRLGHQLNCPNHDSRELVDCLKSVDGNKIVALHQERMDILSDPLSQYAPSLESVIDHDTFMYRHPVESISKGLFNHVPWMLGVNSAEGLVYSARIIRNKNVTYRINNDWENTAPILLNYDRHRFPDVAEKVREFYLGTNYFQAPNDFRKDFAGFTKMFTDRLYATATRRSAIEHSKYAPVFTYHLTYEGDFTFYNIFLSSGSFPRILELGYSVISNWVKENIFRKTRQNQGACHVDDIYYLFHLGLLANIKSNERDYKMSKAMVRAWSQFAMDHTKLKFLNHIWPPIERNDLLYMNLNTYNGGLMNDPFQERAEFWESMDLL